MLSEPLFTRASTEPLATPFLPVLSKCKPGNSPPISWDASSLVKTQNVKPDDREREETQASHMYFRCFCKSSYPSHVQKVLFHPCSFKMGRKNAPCLKQLRPRAHTRRQRACSRRSPTPQPAQICTERVGP